MFRPILILAITFSLSLPQLQGQSCASDVSFAFADEETVVLFNLSPAYDSVKWDLDNGFVISQNEGTVVVKYDSFPVTVCLTIFGSDGCSSIACAELYPGSPEDICQTDDCIWPGDANGDGLANHFDLLNIGPGFGAVGKSRHLFPYPDQPTAWMPNFGEDWDKDIDGLNYKHLDANGNGQVEEADIAAIQENYAPDLEYQSFQQEDAPEIYLEFTDSLITVDPNNPEPLELGIRIGIGSQEIPVENLRGIAFSLDYPGAIVEPGSAKLSYNDASFFGSPDQVLTLYRDLLPVSLSRVDVALSQRGSSVIDGFGTLFTGTFIVIADIAVGKGETIIPFELNLSKVLLLDGNGNSLPVRIDPEAASVGLQIGTVTSTDSGPLPENTFELYPNPTSGLTRLQWTNSQPEWIEVSDALGRTVARFRPERQSFLEWDTRNWIAGLYVIRIETPEGMAVKRLMVR